MKSSLLAAAAALLVSSCGPGNVIEGKSPDIRGSIEAIIPAAAGARDVIGVIRVTGTKEPDTQYDRGDMMVNASTRIVRRTSTGDQPVTFDSLKVGQQVEAKYNDAVMQSYPVRGTAQWIVVTEEKKR
jgi:hypothetical protein